MHILYPSTCLCTYIYKQVYRSFTPVEPKFKFPCDLTCTYNILRCESQLTYIWGCLFCIIEGNYSTENNVYLIFISKTSLKPTGYIFMKFSEICLPNTFSLHFFKAFILVPLGRSKFPAHLGSCWTSSRKRKAWGEKPREKAFPPGLSQWDAFQVPDFSPWIWFPLRMVDIRMVISVSGNL